MSRGRESSEKSKRKKEKRRPTHNDVCAHSPGRRDVISKRNEPDLHQTFPVLHITFYTHTIEARPVQFGRLSHSHSLKDTMADGRGGNIEERERSQRIRALTQSAAHSFFFFGYSSYYKNVNKSETRLGNSNFLWKERTNKRKAIDPFSLNNQLGNKQQAKQQKKGGGGRGRQINTRFMHWP